MAINRPRQGQHALSWIGLVLGLCAAVGSSIQSGSAEAQVVVSPLWVNHFSLLPGDPTVVSTSANSATSGVGSGLTGLVIMSSTTGEVDSFGGNKEVHMALNLPRNTIIKGVRVCYELTSSSSFISQITLAQVEDPPSFALVLLDDGTDRTALGPICVDSASTNIASADGAVLLSLRVNFGNTSDKIVIRALGLL